MATEKVKLRSVNDSPSPKAFKKPVEIVLLDGEIAEIELNFIYRSRSEYAALIDEKLAEEKAAEEAVAKLAAEAAEDKAKQKPIKTVAEWYTESDQAAAKFVLKIANGWDLDDPFTEESLLSLEDKNPGALASIATKYRQSVAEVRVKNW